MDNNKSNWRIEAKTICKILKDNGVNVQKIPTRKTIEKGKRVPITLKDIKEDGIDITKIIKEYELDENYPIGNYIKSFRNLYNGTTGNLTKEEREEVEELGIVIKRNENASAPVFKGGKISEFHLDFIKENLDEILNGKINTKEALELLKNECIKKNETIISDSGSIKKCIEILLKDKPEELKSYYDVVKKNSGRRNPYKGEIGKKKIGMYYQNEKKFNEHIIEYYLPLILDGKITFKTIEEEQHCSHHTINKVIEDFYKKNNDLDGLEEYRKQKKCNMGVALEVRENAKAKREEVLDYEVVGNKEFVILTPEQQEEQIIMKIRKEQLKEELSKTSVRTSALISQDSIKEKINIINKYLKGKNNSETNEIFFSDEDIRYMIFRFPTLIGHTTQNLDKKLDVLTSYEGISKEIAYGMIKTFPAIMGYDASRTKMQLDILEKEKLIDAVIDSPRRFMNSANLLYAQIQYAKERNKTSDLKNINRNNIFMANSTLKKLYGISFDDIKEKYPFNEKVADNPTQFSEENIGKATINVDTELKDKLQQVTESKLKDKKIGRDK